MPCGGSPWSDALPPTHQGLCPAAHQPRPVQARHHALLEALHRPRGLPPPHKASTRHRKPLPEIGGINEPHQHGHNGAERQHAAPPVPASRSSHRWSSWLLARVFRRPGRGRRRPLEARPQLLGRDLDHGAGAAVLGGPCPLLESAHDHHPGALRQGLRGMLGLVPPDNHGEERRLLLLTGPLTVTRNMALD
jgi:hypothetical protein